ncbi:hypothetical protein [Austwickia sp. TVS 96-490-7B]|uniref:hypothetical protein n=1 Tax=Austwickia sp. TVS 96-490-7B TaxID=2830843 RepID=UPI0021079405|nr:hypothetical protein [Austwickia sp. TVS 96-490-7B]
MPARSLPAPSTMIPVLSVTAVTMLPSAMSLARHTAPGVRPEVDCSSQPLL